MARTPIRGTSGKDKLDVLNGFNDVFGLGDDDTIRLLSSGDTGGNNFVDAGSGNDGVVNNFEGGNRIVLGDGNDTYLGLGFDQGASSDEVRGGGGDDLIVVQTLLSTYFGGSGDDKFVSDGWRNDFFGDGGIDTISYEARHENSTIGNTGVEVRLDQGQAFTTNSFVETLVSIENVRGSERVDTIVGNEVANKLEGLGGDDLIGGNGGNDRLFGGDGDDELQGGDGNDELSGGADNDLLFGEVGDDTMAGGSGDDRLFGESGEDVLLGDSGNDTLFGGASADELQGGSGNDVLHGEGNSDKLFGNSGDDELIGSTGNDTLTGGTGKDKLTGGEHDDRFDFNSISEISETPTSAKRDVITDFTRGVDRIDFSTIDANSTRTSNQTFALRAGEQTSFSGTAGEIFWDKTGSGATARTIISGDINGDRVADFQLELIGHITLSSVDFIL